LCEDIEASLPQRGRMMWRTEWCGLSLADHQDKARARKHASSAACASRCDRKKEKPGKAGLGQRMIFAINSWDRFYLASFAI
jgi:hypothetical protein